MPDSRVKIFHGEFPERDFTEKMKLGDKFIWVPGVELRRAGCRPTLYRMEKYNSKWDRQPYTVLMPYPLIAGHHG